MTKSGRHFDKMDFIAEEGRQDIYHWYERRQRKYSGFRKSVHVFRIFAFNGQVLRSFVENFNFMVLLQMAVAGLVTYACKSFGIVYDVHVSLFISPIVFPLAFSINTDFQRKEKVLDDLALFKSSAMMWIFCMRDWREGCSFDDHYMKAIRNKIKGLMFHLREYLFTEKLDRRKFIVRVIYEDLSDTNQINEKVRNSNLNANSPLVSRVIHFLNMMCLAFERLRVIREYRSPRSIRSFTKVLIFALPILLSPYYVYLGDKLNNNWAPYYISTMVAFVFGALQGVQDKLDDPFDGMSEDDIKLDTLDEWTIQSLEATVHRTYKVGRFQVSSNPSGTHQDAVDGNIRKGGTGHPHFRHFHGGSFSKQTPLVSPRSIYNEEGDEFDVHPYAGVLHNIKGNTTIRRGGQIRNYFKSYDDLSYASTMTKDASTSKMSHGSKVSFNLLDSNSQQPSPSSASTNLTRNNSSNNLQSMPQVSRPSSSPNLLNQHAMQTTPHLDFSETDVPLSGVMSYLLNMRLQQEAGKTRSRPNSNRSNSPGHSTKSGPTSRTNSPKESLTNSRPEFFIGEPGNTVKRLSTPPPPMVRSLSMPETQGLLVDKMEFENHLNESARLPVSETNSLYHLIQDTSQKLTDLPFRKIPTPPALTSRFRISKGNPESPVRDPLLGRQRNHRSESFCSSSGDEEGVMPDPIKPNNSFSINLHNLPNEETLIREDSSLKGHDHLMNLFQRGGVVDSSC